MVIVIVYPFRGVASHVAHAIGAASRCCLVSIAMITSIVVTDRVRLFEIRGRFPRVVVVIPVRRIADPGITPRVDIVLLRSFGGFFPFGFSRQPATVIFAIGFCTPVFNFDHRTILPSRINRPYSVYLPQFKKIIRLSNAGIAPAVIAICV